jgi:arylsulfatase A
MKPQPMRIPLLMAAACLACLSASAAERPNVLLIFADDIGYEALNCYGGLDFETPNPNRMAEQGLAARNLLSAGGP